MPTAIADAPAESTIFEQVDARTTYRKVTWRLIPFLFVCYFVNYLDRANIGFAKLQFVADLGFSDAVYGLGAGLFFVGYVLFEVPSNLLMQRIGTRATIARIMFLWGLASACTAFVRTPTELYVVRFLLGAAEAGFFPGVILYLTYWYPAHRRGRITSLFMGALTISGIVGNPLSGFIMSRLAGINGLHGWQMLFLVEGVPAMLLGISAWFMLKDTPAHATWLSRQEKDLIVSDLAADGELEVRKGASFRNTLLDVKVYVVGFVSASMFAVSVSFALWVPSLIKELGVSDIQRVGWLSAIPYAISLVGMAGFGYSSDRRLERRWHAASAIAACGICLLLLPFTRESLVLSIALLSVGAACLYGAIVVFWTIPPAYLSAKEKGGGIALVSSIAAVSGFFAPTLVGAVKAHTGSLYLGLCGVGVVALIGASVLVLFIPATDIREAGSAR